jgi:D-alanine-D-alanine ligase
MMNKKIIVLMGGPSSEREVSLNTGNAILAALQSKGYNAIGLELDPPRLFEQLKEHQGEVVFNAIHGKFGEDGYLQGALELLDIPYTGSGVLASAIAMDKAVSKQIFKAKEIPTPPAKLFKKEEINSTTKGNIIAEFGLPVVVKAVAQGSSIGVTIAENDIELSAAIEIAKKYDNNILIEQYIKGRELTVAVMGSADITVLPIIEIVPHSGKYDYQSKYTKGATDYLVPAQLTQTVADKVSNIAENTFKALGCKGVARVDFMLDQAENPYVLEVNTIPGMTATSLVPKAAKSAGITFEDLCEKILLMALKK